jgi:hypothetical protein
MTDMRTIFSAMYQHNGFLGSESPSGPGSSLSRTAGLRVELPKILQSFGIRRIVDAPCGDMNWMRHLEYQFDLFIGVDIVPEVILRVLGSREVRRGGGVVDEQAGVRPS